MPFWQPYYHLVWATKDREPLLTVAIEPLVHEFLISKAVGLGATVFALNGTEDHVHMVVSVPPRLALATFVGQVKGVSSARINTAGEELGGLYWQREYGAFSLDGKRLPSHVAYVTRQKEHHRDRTVIPILERTDAAARVLGHEGGAVYAIEDAAWREDLLADDE